MSSRVLQTGILFDLWWFMKTRFCFFSLAAFALFITCVSYSRTQARQYFPDEMQSWLSQERLSQELQTQEKQDDSRGGPQGRGRPLFGKLSAIHNDSIEITTEDGSKVSVKVDAKTEFRKERQPAKIADFKVGDAVIVRTNQESENAPGATATMVAAVPPDFALRGGGPGGMPGTMGKDYVVGEVKSIDPPKLTILRTDSVTQTLELNEETSLHRGRDSITMADIQPGDHVFARGAMANDVFVPKGLNVISPEQWKRMQEMNGGRGTRGPATPNAPTPPGAATPPEQSN